MPLLKAKLLLLTAVISGCSLSPSLPPQEYNPLFWPLHQQLISEQTHWSLKGKIGIFREKKHASASLSWDQQGKNYRIYMAGPLGQGAVNIQGTEHKIDLEISGDGHYSAANPEALLMEHLGWSLPVSDLHYWIKGLPAPNSPHTKHLNPQHQLASLFQDGWDITYKSYQRIGETVLPRKIVLEREHIRLTLVIKEWQLNDLNTPPDPRS
jgi:outer membrane lipoprotein LolB